MRTPSPLPYTDAKPTGAADFYFAINATFKFILNRTGLAGLQRYWSDLGSGYFRPVTQAWTRDGLPAVAAYWRAFFAAEPGAEVTVTETPEAVQLEVKVCPALAHLRREQRAPVPCFCQHCYFIGEAMARPAGLTVRVEGGNGQCRQTFQKISSARPPQDLAAIREAAC